MDVAVPTTVAPTFGPIASVILRLHLGLWWAAGPQRPSRGMGVRRQFREKM